MQQHFTQANMAYLECSKKFDFAHTILNVLLWFTKWSMLFCLNDLLSSVFTTPLIFGSVWLLPHHQFVKNIKELGANNSTLWQCPWKHSHSAVISSEINKTYPWLFLIHLMYAMLILCSSLLIRILCSVQLVVPYRDLSVLYNTINLYQSKM